MEEGVKLFRRFSVGGYGCPALPIPTGELCTINKYYQPWCATIGECMPSWVLITAVCPVLAMTDRGVPRRQEAVYKLALLERVL